MNMPGFNAEASLRRTMLGYEMIWSFDQLGNMVWPQLWCDPTCLDNCLDPSDCDELPTPQARAACRQAAARCRIHCCCPTPPTCGPCTPTGRCNPDCTPIRTQSCTDCHGHFTQTC